MRSRQQRPSASPQAPRRFTKLLAANHSEIAIRIFRAALIADKDLLLKLRS